MQRTLIALCTAGVLLSPALAEERATITLRLENDLFYKADREYTSGAGLTWTTAAGASTWATDLAKRLPFFPQGAEVRVGYSLDLAQFTPTDTSLTNPIATDRPYAAWLNGTLEITASTENRLSRTQLQLGVVGPWALGEQAQNFIHRLRGFSLAQGWHFQLHNEPGLVLRTEQSWRHPLAESLDVIAHAGAAVGNVYDTANAGLTFRLGQLTRDFAPARIEPSIPGSNLIDPNGGWYVFAGAELRAVARNIFLDGNTFEASRSVSKYPFVAEAQIGAVVTLGSFRVAYTHAFLSREYRTQADNHQYGAISVSTLW